MRVMVLRSSFNGLSQRVWSDLRAAGHAVTLQLGADAGAVTAAVRAADPDLIVCPFLRGRVPSEVWQRWRTIIIHPGPIISCTRQIVVAAVAGNAGAGGVMLALGADRVLLRDGVMLNPHYRTMGLYGSEYWTYVLPRRVGGGRRVG